MKHSDNQRARLNAASEALAEFRHEWQDLDDEPSDSDYDNLVARHSDVAQELRKLIEQSRRGQMESDEQSDAVRRSREALERTLQELAGSVSFGQRYELRGEIGRGGMGAVIRVIDRKLGRPLAMKIIVGQADAERSGGTPQVEPHRVARFLNEARITGQLEHPGIVPVHEVGVDSLGRVYFTMKLIEGQTLAEVLERQRGGDPAWTMPRVLTVIERVCEAMALAHDRRVIHRDLKPANIMVGRFGEVYVMDWGVARRLDEGEETAESVAEVDAELRERVLRTGDGAAVGTPGYMSPEQARGDIANVGPTSDVYSIGAMLREVITGVRPLTGARSEFTSAGPSPHQFTGPHQETYSRVAPPELIAICEKAMANQPAHRYPSLRELGEDLTRFLSGQTVRAFDTGTWAETKKWVLRNRSLAVSLATAVILLIVGFTASLIFKRKADARAEALQTANTTITKQNEEANRNLYNSSVKNAQNALLAGESGALRRILDIAPPMCRNWEWSYLNALSDSSLLTVSLDGENRSGRVRLATLSPDDTRLATITANHRVEILDVPSGRRIANCGGHEATISWVAFSSDGARIATASSDHTARVWDAASGDELTRLQCNNKVVWSVDFSPDGSRILTTTTDGEVSLWHVASGKQLFRLEGQRRPSVEFTPFSRDGLYVVTLPALESQSAPVQPPIVWDTGTGNECARLAGHAGVVVSATFSPDGKRIVTAAMDKTARVWDVKSGNEMSRLEGHTQGLWSAFFSSDGQLIVTTAWDNTARIWDATSGKEVAQMQGKPPRRVRLIPSASIDGGRGTYGEWGYIVTAEDNLARVWAVPDGKQEVRLAGHTRDVYSTLFSPKGSFVLTISLDNTARVWDARPAVLTDGLGIFSKACDGTINQASISKDGFRIVLGSHYGSSASVYDFASGRRLAQLDGHTQAVELASFNGDGSRILTASRDGTVRVWDAATGVEIRRVGCPEVNDGPACFNSDGSRLASASSANWVSVWDTVSGAVSGRLEGHADKIQSVAFSPDGSRIVTASRDGSARVWNSTSCHELTRLVGHSDGVEWAAFSNDGSRIVTAGNDGTARVWNGTSGKELVRLEVPDRHVKSANFSPDGTRILTTSDDHTVRVWDASLGVELCQLLGRGDDEVIQSAAYFGPDGARVVVVADHVHVFDAVPYRNRYQERQAYLAARQEAEVALTAALAGGKSFVEAGENLRANEQIGPVARHAALDMLIERAQAEQSRQPR